MLVENFILLFIACIVILINIEIMLESTFKGMTELLFLGFNKQYN
jgi:hypothetical protein